MTKNTIIISLGGSLVAPNEIDIKFLKSFSKNLRKYFNKYRFFILVGGGKTARNYQKALLEFKANSTDRDWIGIDASKLNAQVVKHVFNKHSFSEIITNPNKKIKTTKKVVVGAGWKPGWSTDYCAVLAAKTNGIKKIINLTNIDYVYEKDPKKYPNAKPLKQVGWREFCKIVGSKWSPGLSMPFDPRASKLAKQLKLKVAIINGKNLKSLDNFLNNKPFRGTIIEWQ